MARCPTSTELIKFHVHPRLCGDVVRIRTARGSPTRGPPVRTWVVQGTGDEVCPEGFARQLAAGLTAANVPHTAYFFDAGHSAKSDKMSSMLRQCVDEFACNSAMVVR